VRKLKVNSEVWSDWEPFGGEAKRGHWCSRKGSQIQVLSEEITD